MMLAAPAVIAPPASLSISSDVPCALEASTNLVNWSDTGATTPASVPASQPEQFYRGVRWQGSITLSWDPITDPAVAGVKIYLGTNSQSYTTSVDVGTANPATIEVPVAAVYYIAATTYGADGNESDFSSEITYQFSQPNLIITRQ